MYAFCGNNEKLVKSLIEHGVYVNDMEEKHGFTLLLLSLNKNNKNIVKIMYILQKKINLENYQ